MKQNIPLVVVFPTTLKSGRGAARWSGVAIWVLFVALVAPRAVAETEAALSACTFCDGVRLGDEIVVVNSRMLCGSCEPESLRKGLRVERYTVTDEVGHRRWRRSDLDEFLSFDPSVPTVIYVHGNQITSGQAKSQGLAVYRRLMHYGCEEGPIRFAIFSWPAARTGRLLRDVREKAQRTGPAGCQLAWLVDQMPAETPLSMIGFSFGARIVTASLHVLAGGSLGWGCELRERTASERPPVKVVLIAAALHANWLGKGQHHGLAMTQVDQMFLLNNCRDLALRYYHLSSTGRGRPQALGLHGPTCIGSEYATKIQMRDVSGTAGREHDLFMYLCAPGATGQVWAYTNALPPDNRAEPVASTVASTRGQ